MKNFILISFGLVLFSIIGCTEHTKQDKSELDLEKPLVKKSLNPNGDSELAILMREMFEELDEAKTQISKGEKVELKVNHKRILEAESTEAEKAETEEFKAFAKVYLKNVEKMRKSSATDQQEHYQTLVSNCMSCHQAICPGPLVRIKKLKTSFAKI